MGLSDEIEKLIATHRNRLDRTEVATVEHNRRQQERFAPLRSVIDQVVASIEPEFINARISDGSAFIQIGRPAKAGGLDAEITVQIQPNFETNPEGRSGGASFVREAPGFRVMETNFYEFPEYHESENERTLSTEQEVPTYLINLVTEKVAYYRHLASRHAGNNQ